MSAVELLNELQARGVRVAAEGDRLRLKGPRGAVTPKLRRRLTARKSDVLALLKSSRDSELMALCRRVCAGLDIDPVLLWSFLEVGEDPDWRTERVVRHIARRMVEHSINISRHR